MPGSELVTLFGAELPEVGAARIGIVVAGGTKVSAGDLSAMLLALSIADLADRGAATLAEGQVKKLFRTHETLSVRSEEAGEGFTLAVSKAAQEEVPVDQLALRLLGQAVATPELALIGMAHGLLEPTGAVVRPDGGAKARVGKMLHVEQFEIDEQAAESLRDEWTRLCGVWEAWKAKDGSRADLLVDRSRAALGEAKDLSD